jgi:hypothetical protein
LIVQHVGLLGIDFGVAMDRDTINFDISRLSAPVIAQFIPPGVASEAAVMISNRDAGRGAQAHRKAVAIFQIVIAARQNVRARHCCKGLFLAAAPVPSAHFRSPKLRHAVRS